MKSPWHRFVEASVRRALRARRLGGDAELAGMPTIDQLVVGTPVPGRRGRPWPQAALRRRRPIGLSGEQQQRTPQSAQSRAGNQCAKAGTSHRVHRSTARDRVSGLLGRLVQRTRFSPCREGRHRCMVDRVATCPASRGQDVGSLADPEGNGRASTTRKCPFAGEKLEARPESNR